MFRTDKLIHSVFVASLVLGVIGILPFFFNTAMSSKLFIVVLTAILAGLTYAFSLIKNKKFEVTTAPLVSLYALFTVSVLVSAFFTNQYPVQNLLGLGGFQLASAVLLFFGANVLAKENRAHIQRQALTNTFIDGLLVAGAVVGFASLLQLFGVGPSKLLNAVFSLNLPNTVLFNLTGSAFVAAQVAAIALISLVYRAINQRRMNTIDMVSLPFILLAVVINVWAILPGKPAAIVLPDFAASWSIAIDSLRTPRSALIGFGTDAYSDVFTRFKPIWMNGRENWQLVFGSATNYPLTLISTQGLFGLVSWLLLLVAVVKHFKNTHKDNKPIGVVVLLTFMLPLLLPVNLVVLSIQTLALLYWIASEPDFFSVIQLRTQAIKTDANSEVKPESNHLLPMIVGWLLVLLMLFPIYSAYRAFAGFYRMYRADVATFKNDPVSIYEQQRQAVVAMPYLDSIRRQYAITNLQIAVALSNNKDLSEADREQITQLISQAIREAKAATILDPNNVQNWVILAEIYRNISGVAKEADQWAVDSLVSAIQTDPTNPLLRIDLGQTFFDKAQYEDAARFFNQAIELKPDLAGGYFQLGRALKEVGQLENAKTLLEKSKTLVKADSEEYGIITKGISELDQAIAASASGKKAATQSQPKINDNGLLDTGKKAATGSALLNLTKEGDVGLGSLTEQNTTQSQTDIVNDTQSEPLRVNTTPTP